MAWLVKHIRNLVGAPRTLKIHGGCHCGNIRYDLDWPGDGDQINVRACGCGFCQKHGGVWTSHRDATLAAQIADGSSLSRYKFGTETADFFVCSACGVAPFVVSEIESHAYSVVNVNTFENVDPATIVTAPSDFEGEATESRLNRRQTNWIPNVRVSMASSE